MPGEKLEPGKVYVNKQSPVKTGDSYADPTDLAEAGMNATILLSNISY
jgi:hypothetical protein